MKKIQAFKEQLNRKLMENIKRRQTNICPTPPRYDDIFFEGLAQLDEASGFPAIEGQYLISFAAAEI